MGLFLCKVWGSLQKETGFNLKLNRLSVFSPRHLGEFCPAFAHVEK